MDVIVALKEITERGAVVRMRGDELLERPYWERYNWDDPEFRKALVARIHANALVEASWRETQRDIAGFRRIMGAR